MQKHKVNGIWHYVYELEEVPSDISFNKNWREAEVGDWVLTDDDYVIQVLRKGTMLKAKGKKRKVHYIGTCTGTFPAIKTAKMDASRRENIYSFGGRPEAESVMKRDSLTKYEAIFVNYIIAGMDPKDAYMKAFKTRNPGYAGIKAGRLLKTERVTSEMKKELEPVMEELGIDESFILKAIKEVAELSDKDETRLKALFKLSDILDMEDKNKTSVTQISGAVFQGFSDDMIEAAERPKEIE